ncbi:MAG: 2-oxo-4-hydroxy-4-carboxy-5-ureidoimidazoline decarboxylase [Candidatus Parcubacteria bacterium]|uniref:2-oxo-4-hydroxy-4-carboxy-5-ureidoimidazoline decarboxylase n=1 Tax=Phormidesmis priestleyi TaxID=268141 RepID=UPI00083A96B1|nr:2-oxo-4-hydroxy-4-carboxy-5-ureidoimidazoline decarboxylase [Phormidesmis priestleyi]MBC7823770.1 2-oxo-4-hydroxy-4-carboxy-5-ureidoimidazoline decarboxylase [Leptolyngbyaceae cyanobacterium LF-bin-113]
MGYSIAQLNQMSQSEFVERLGAVFEETPTIAQQVWEQRPFADVDNLHQKMTAIVKLMSQTDQLRLIRAHPDLGSKAKMAEASVQEQSGVGLDRLSSQEYARFQSLNQAYKDKFGFPFIIAVKNHSKSSVLYTFDQRLKNSLSAEITQALIEISTIAHFRLMSLIESSS